MSRFHLNFLISLLLAAGSFGPAPGQGQILFKSDFRNLPFGSDGSPVWTVTKGDWVATRNGLLQRSLEYDCGLIHSSFLNGVLQIKIHFQTISGEEGGGLFFSSSSKQDTRFAHMVRFDGPSRLLIGYFQDGEFAVQAFGYPGERTTSTSELMVLVDPQKSCYSVFVDGATVADSIPLLYPAGYWGLQSSGGKSVFLRAEVRRLRKISNENSISWPKYFALLENGSALLSDPYHGRLIQVDKYGKVLQILPRSSSHWPIEQPGPVMTLSNGRILLADESNHRLHLFDIKGNWLACVGGKDEFQALTDLDRLKNENLIVLLDKARKQFVLLDDSLDRLATVGENHLREPVAVSASNAEIAVLDQYRSKIHLFRKQNHQWACWNEVPLPPARLYDLIMDDQGFFVSTGKGVWRVSRKGDILSSFEGRTLNQWLPVRLNRDSSGDLWIADFTGNRFIVTDANLAEPLVNFTPIEKGSVAFSWTSSALSRGQLQLRSESRGIEILSDQKPTKNHRIVAKGFRPGELLHVAISPGVRQIPSRKQWTSPQTFEVPPPDGRRQILRLPVLCLLFARVPDSTQSRVPALAETEVQRIRNQISDAVRFYWIHSGCRFWIDLDFLVIHDSIDLHRLVEPLWWYPPRESVIDSVARTRGRSLQNYPAVVCLIGHQEWDESTGRWQLSGRGGGFTNGIAANGQYGMSWWFVTRADHPAGNNWLMVHEFNHQVDELFQTSGYPEYWFNHFAPKLGNVGPFSEHFDGNAYLMHLIPSSWWLDLNRGERMFVVDRDGDGIPDSDPRLPLDEQRLGSSSASGDSDGDGMRDGAELLFSNWILEGQGETYGGKRLLPNLNAWDTDDDGLGDGVDPEPLSAFPTEIPFALQGVDHLAEAGASFLFRDETLSARIVASWDSMALYWRIDMDAPATIKLQVDADQNGWFVGNDNWIILLENQGDSFRLHKSVFDASSYEDWPKMNPELAEHLQVQTRWFIEDERIVINIKIERNPELGFEAAAGEALGFNIGFQPDSEQENKRFRTVFEPNRLFHAFLVKQEKETK